MQGDAWVSGRGMEGLSLTETHASSRGFGRQAEDTEAAIKDRFKCVLAQKSIICLGAQFVNAGAGRYRRQA